jgi:glycosyltransferase involved in cell wall biosynthesis
MACGLPVAGVDMKGMPEIVRDGVNGVIVRPDTPRDMAARVVTLLRDRENLRRYAAASAEFAQGFSQDRVMAEWEEIYQSVYASYR